MATHAPEYVPWGLPSPPPPSRPTWPWRTMQTQEQNRKHQILFQRDWLMEYIPVLHISPGLLESGWCCTTDACPLLGRPGRREVRGKTVPSFPVSCKHVYIMLIPMLLVGMRKLPNAFKGLYYTGNSNTNCHLLVLIKNPSRSALSSHSTQLRTDTGTCYKMLLSTQATMA